MATDAKAIGYLELNSKQFEDAIAFAKQALVGLSAAFAAVKTVDFWKDGIEDAIKFGNEAYFAAQKLNGYDPGKLFIVQKALQAGGLAAEEARDKIEEFGLASRPLEQLFKGGQSGFTNALMRASKEYGTQAQVLSRSAEEFAVVQGQIGALGTKLQGFFLGLADKIANPLSALLSQIDKIDLVGMGEKFGGYIVDAVNVIRGLIQNKNLFSTLSLALKVGFEEAVNYLAGALNTTLSFLMQGNLWSGIAKVAVGALGIIGTFLTSIILGIGKLLVATIEAAFERLRNKYALLLAIISPAAGLANAFGAKASPDVGENLKNIENNSLIKSQESGASSLTNKALSVANAGLKDLNGLKVSFTPSKTYDTANDSKTLADSIAKAIKSGQNLASPNGTKNTLFSEKADPYHVIADSLARVGGGGRYVRTGLSIADKAAMDSLRYQKQQTDIQKSIDKGISKLVAGKNGVVQGG